jgi:predicted MFS family arabinose efflux permease
MTPINDEGELPQNEETLHNVESDTEKLLSKPNETKFTIKNIFAFIYPIFVVLLMFYASALRTTHRQFLNVASKPIKRDLKISDDLFGGITGPIFSIGHAFAGVFIGRLCDVYRYFFLKLFNSSRKLILILMVIVWTSFNCLHAIVQNYWQLILVRIGLAAGMGAVPSGKLFIYSFSCIWVD